MHAKRVRDVYTSRVAKYCFSIIPISRLNVKAPIRLFWFPSASLRRPRCAVNNSTRNHGSSVNVFDAILEPNVPSRRTITSTSRRRIVENPVSYP